MSSPRKPRSISCAPETMPARVSTLRRPAASSSTLKRLAAASSSTPTRKFRLNGRQPSPTQQQLPVVGVVLDEEALLQWAPGVPGHVAVPGSAKKTADVW